MPDNSAYLATLAKSGHKIEGWFFPFDWGDPVLVADVTATPAFPTYNLAISVTSGNASAVDYGMVYTISTAGGLYKGMGTLRYAGTISSSNIPVRELSRGVIDVAVGDVIRVYRTFLPGDKLVGATADFNPDGLSYTDQGSNPPPVNNDLGAWAGKPSQLPIPFANSLGYGVDPDSSSAVTVVRTLPAGLSYATGDDTTLDVTVTGDEGTYWVKSAVTDPDNGKSTTRYTPVCISNSPLECTLESYGGDRDNGWRVSVTFRGTVDLREGQWGAFAVRETMGGVGGSYGSAADGRSHVKFVGIVRRRSFDVDGTGARTVTYEFLSPLAWLLETPGFSKVMLDKASPANWMEMKTLGTKRAKLQIIQFYSNLNQVGCDVVFRSNYRNKRYPGFFIEKNTPIGQLRELASGVGAVLICTRQGRFEFVTDPRLLPLASRSSVATMLALTNDHIIRASFQQEMKDALEKMYFSGFVAGASGNAPFRIAFPGKAPGTGVQSPQFDKVICDSITDAEEEAGRRGGMVQQVFHDSNGQKHRVVTGELVLFGAFDVFDLYGEWITLPAIPNAAGIDTSAYRFVIDSISVEYTSGTARVTLRVSGETNAPKGQYDPPPPEEGVTFPDYSWDYGAPIGLPSFPPGVLSGVSGAIGFMDEPNGLLYYTFNRGQTWFRLDPSLTGSFLDFVSHPLSPKYRGTGSDIWLKFITSTRAGQLKFNPITQALSDIDEQETHTAAVVGRIEMERAAPRLAVATLTTSGGETSVIRSTDDATWSSPAVLNASGGSNYSAGGLYVSGKAPGVVYAGKTTTGANAQGQRSANGGLSFAHDASLDADGSCFGLHIPWNDNDDSRKYFGEWAGTGQPRKFTRLAGGVQTDISPTDGGESWGAQLQRSIDSFPGNRRIMAACLRNGDQPAGADTIRVYYTSDDWATKNYIAALDGPSGSKIYFNLRFAGDMPVFWAFGDGAAIALCDPISGGYEDWSGNLASFSSPSVGRISNIFGLGV